MTEFPPSGPSGDPNVPPAAPQYPQQQPPAYGQAPAYGQQPPAYGQQPQYGQPQYGAPGMAGGVSDADRKMWAMLAHLGGIILGFIAPIIVWAMYKDKDEFLKDQSTEALNFQITVMIGWAVSFVLSFVVIGAFLMPILWIVNLVFCILGGMAANRGERYRYPFALRLVK